MQPARTADPDPMSVRFAPRFLAALAATVALAAAVCGCGSTQATLDPIAQAAQATTHSGGSQIAMTASVQSPGLGSTLTVRGNGSFNMSRQEGELFFDVDGLPAAAQARLPGGHLQLTELFKDGVLYMGSPLFEGKLPGGAKWMKLDLAKVESSLGIDVQSLSSGQSNPTEFLQYLRGSGGSVTAAGRERVRGVETTRYEGTVDLERAAEQIPASDRGKLEAAIKQLIAKTGVRSYPVTVWIDDHHLVRRMEMKMTISAGAATGAATIDFEMFGFGASPGVNAPAAGETFDATKLSLQSLAPGG
jgi:hypothetical protein